MKLIFFGDHLSQFAMIFMCKFSDRWSIFEKFRNSQRISTRLRLKKKNRDFFPLRPINEFCLFLLQPAEEFLDFPYHTSRNFTIFPCNQLSFFAIFFSFLAIGWYISHLVSVNEKATYSLHLLKTYYKKKIKTATRGLHFLLLVNISFKSGNLSFQNLVYLLWVSFTFIFYKCTCASGRGIGATLRRTSKTLDKVRRLFFNC